MSYRAIGCEVSANKSTIQCIQKKEEETLVWT